MPKDLQGTYRKHWVDNNHGIRDFSLPIVGDWVLEYAIVHDHPHADEFLIGRMYDGNLDGLNTLLHAENFESRLMSLLNVFLEVNPEQRSRVHQWILERPILLQNRDPDWQRWIRNTLFVQ